MAPGKSIGYSRFDNRYKMVVIIEMYGRIFFTLNTTKTNNFLLKILNFGKSFDPPCSFYNWLKEEEKKKKKL